MRVMARRFGASYTLCEVMLDQFLARVGTSRKNLARLAIADEEHPVGGQLMGANPDDFAPAARRLVEAGFDCIDINFGCPVKKVLGRCRGGFLLSTPDTALEIVSRVREAVPTNLPVTLKMRRGIDDSQDSQDKFFTIFDGAFSRGISAITVHGRSVMQRYNGPSNWDFLAAVKRHAGDRTVLGSGDLFSAQACVSMLAHTGVDGVTIARGAIGNPWIFQANTRTCSTGSQPEDLQPPRILSQRDVLSEHLRLAVELHGEATRQPNDEKICDQVLQTTPRFTLRKKCIYCCKKLGRLADRLIEILRQGWAWQRSFRRYRRNDRRVTTQSASES